jgi:hypothetical protein
MKELFLFIYLLERSKFKQNKNKNKTIKEVTFPWTDNAKREIEIQGNQITSNKR